MTWACRNQIPHKDLAIQIDLALEFALLSGVWYETFWKGPQVYLPKDDTLFDVLVDKIVRLASTVSRSSSVELSSKPANCTVIQVAQDVQLGFHFCYGDFAKQHFAEPPDTGLIVSVAFAILSRLKRSVDYIVLPVRASGLLHQFCRRLPINLLTGELAGPKGQRGRSVPRAPAETPTFIGCRDHRVHRPGARVRSRRHQAPDTDCKEGLRRQIFRHLHRVRLGTSRQRRAGQCSGYYAHGCQCLLVLLQLTLLVTQSFPVLFILQPHYFLTPNPRQEISCSGRGSCLPESFTAYALSIRSTSLGMRSFYLQEACYIRLVQALNREWVLSYKQAREPLQRRLNRGGQRRRTHRGRKTNLSVLRFMRRHLASISVDVCRRGKKASCEPRGLHPPLAMRPGAIPAYVPLSLECDIHSSSR